MAFTSDRARAAIATAVLVLLSAIVFAQTAAFQFVWDDKNLIANNPFMHETSTLWRAFSHDFWELTPVSHESGFYRPLTIITYWLEYRLFDGSPAGFHLVNVALHTSCVVLVFRLALRFGLPLLGAVSAAALFAVHPVQVFAAGNISSQTDLIATTCVLAGVLLWTRSSRARWIALPMFLLGLLAKESAVVGPLLAILVARAVGTSPASRVARYAPLLVWFPYGILRLWALGGTGAGAGGASHGGMLYAHYLVRVVMPLPEAPVVTHEPPATVYAILSTAVLAGAVLVIARSRLPVRVRTAWAWFAIALLPVAELVPLGARQNDLLLYLPFVGITLVVGDIAGSSRLRTAVTFLVIATFAAFSTMRVQVWRDSLSLWRHAVRYEPHEPTLRMNYANALRENGETMAGCLELERLLTVELQERPNADVEVRTTYNLGNCVREAGDVAAAAQYYARSFERSGRRLGPAAHNLALMQLELGRITEAIETARALVALDEHNAGSRQLLEMLLARSRRSPTE